MLQRLAYISTSTRPEAERDSMISDILATARERNAQLGVTGALICTDRSFFQTLEGDVLEVKETYDRISLDPRHGNVVKLYEELVEERAFPDWSMGHRDLDEDHPLAKDISVVKSALDIPGMTGANLYLQATAFLSN